MGWLDDLLYPDNEKRRHRTIELYEDCEALTAQLGRQKVAIGTEISDLIATFSEIFSSSGAPRFEAIEVWREGDWSLTAPRVAEALVAPVSDAINAAFLAATIGQVGFGPSHFLRLFGLPEGFPRNPSKTVDITDMYGLIPAAIEGATIRSDLRDMIASLAASRLQLKWVVLRNDALCDALKGLNSYASSVAKSSVEMGADTHELLDIYVEELAGTVEGVGEEKARTALLRLDKYRGSWLEEDG